MNDQSRGDWPSASAWEANKLCSLRHLAQHRLPSLPEDPDCESGRAIHAAWARKPYRNLVADEQESLGVIYQKEGEIVKCWDYCSSPVTKIFREKRLWHSWETDGKEYRCSGQADVIYLDPPRALILDGKTGRKGATPEPENLQLRVLAALVALNDEELCDYQIEEVTVALLQNWKPANPPCVYDAFALAQATVEMEGEVEAWYSPNAKRVASPKACEYCKAQPDCPAFAASGLPVRFSTPPPPTTAEIEQSIAEMDSKRLGAFLSLCRLAEECASQQVRTRLGDGITVEGWQLSPGRTTEKIVNPQALFERFVLAGGKTEQFHKSITVQKGKFKDAAREATGLKGRALESKVEELLEGLTEAKMGQGVLERID